MRQKPIGDFIVDFYCSKLKLIIEIDGDSHVDKEDEDKFRESKLEVLGLKLIRFNNEDVKKNMDGVIENLLNKIEEIENNNPLAPFTKGE